MFFKQVWRNVARDRKGNSLFFGSLIIAIIAFYTLLSLDKQDVMVFLGTIESEAVHKLMMLIPVVYVVSLFFVLFLVYFACRYQTDSRRKEFGLYLMLGMKRSRLFAMLMCETLLSGIISIAVGLPTALLLTEATSLITAKAIGLGIIGHKISFSPGAVLWTVAGFIAVQMISMLVICIKFSKTEPGRFIQSDSADKQENMSDMKKGIYFALGVIFLLTAYTLGVLFLRKLDLTILAVLVFGAVGTFMLYKGLGGVIGGTIRRKSPSRSGLYTFTGRQVQENVLHQHKTLAVASLLVLMALACISYGIGVSTGIGSAELRSVDFSVKGDDADISAALENEKNAGIIKAYYPMYLSMIKYEEYEFDISGLMAEIEKQPQSDIRDNILETFTNRSMDYIISEESFNAMMASSGKGTIDLGGTKMALYTSMDEAAEFNGVLRGALRSGTYVELDGTRYELLPELYGQNVVADRAITLYAALIVPDEMYTKLAYNNEPFCINIRLTDEYTDELGLMQAIDNVQKVLAAAGLEYESYLTGIGRNLFYTVAGSYLTIYLGVLFLIIANTVIGLKYLIQQRANRHRYTTLLMLGANTDDLCASSGKQIQTFFALVLGVAVCSSVFAVWAMFVSYAKLPEGSSPEKMFLLAGIAAVLFVVIEAIYIGVVKRISSREIRALNVTDRG